MQIFSSDFPPKEDQLSKKMDRPYEVVMNGDIGLRSSHRMPPVAKFTADANGMCTEFNDAPIPKSCSIIMNGNYDIGPEQPKRTRDDSSEAKPFGDQREMCNSRCSSSRVSDIIPTSNSATSTLLSTTIKESSVANSGDSESEGEPEISRHLLRDSDEEDPNSKCPRTMPKIPTFRSSPKKFTDPHSHIQHRPLGRYTSSTPASSQAPPSQGKWNWTVVKLICVVLFMSFVAAVTCIVVGLFLTGPHRCESNRDWWQSSVTYEIFPASFQDTDGDGFGDFNGITRKLYYIKNLSADVIRLNSIFSALDYPLEYEHVIDFANVDPHLGKLDDFKDMVNAIHDSGMYLVLDMNPSVTSDQHSWAAHWLLHRPGRYENFYVNVTDEEEEPPRELQNDNDEPADTNPHRTFGSHLYLNWTNPMVQFEILKVLEFWLQLGVDGFYMKHLEKIKIDHPREMLFILHRWRRLLDRHSTNTTTKVLATSFRSIDALYKMSGVKLFTSMPALFHFVDAVVDFSVNRTLEVSDSIWKSRKWIAKFPHPPAVMWHFGSAETPRLASRVGSQYTMNCMFLLALLPGSVSIFYGDEIGMKDSFDTHSKKIFRGGQLVPMQWTALSNANFTGSASHPWLPMFPEHKTSNVDNLASSLAILSRLLSFKKASFHSTPHPRTGMMRTVMSKFQPNEPEGPNYRWFHDAQNSLVALEVTYDSNHKFLLFANFGTQTIKIDQLVSRQDGNHRWNELDFYRMRVLFSTKSIQSLNVNDVMLEGGQAVLSLYVT